jgi:hypothetical protein
VTYNHASGDQVVPAEESAITFVKNYEVNGVWVDTDWATLRFTPFGELELRPSDRSRHPDIRAPYELFLQTLTDDDYLEDSDPPNRVVIPVSTLEFSVLE